MAPAHPEIHRREEWGRGRPPLGPLSEEEVRFLIVHHSASHNGHKAADAPAIIRSFYDFHTTTRGWNDIAYNFLIDSDGGLWEGRTGSLESPVAGDATGGNQGFTQLVCLIGNYDTARPSSASLEALVSLLAWLANRYDVPTDQGSEASFISRGSNRHPEGTELTTATITGHRAMSITSCPGDNLNAYVIGDLMADVEALRVASQPTTTTTSSAPSTTTTTVGTTTTDLTQKDTTIPPSTTSPVAAAEPGDVPVGMFSVVGALIFSVSGLIMWRHRRMGKK